VQRPLDGVWATAPYLHNGSVRTLADLLTPAPGGFSVGVADFDTAAVGYVSAGVPFDPGTLGDGHGSSAGGHPWGTELQPDEKTALLEYLKSL
jgi:hypothetical protein